MKVNIEQSWKGVLAPQFDAAYFKTLTDFVRNEYKNAVVYPPAKYIFNAFELTPFNKVKVVILGQDPYHNIGQAHGLSFSVPHGVDIPASLNNIYKELDTDLGSETSKESGNLEEWARQGVLLLNATLTVRAHQAGSHQGKGWEQFTDAVIQTLSDRREHLVFILWGRYAREKGKIIDKNKHLILESAHPSPLSAYHGFFGFKPFSKTNVYLEKNNIKPIKW